MCEDSPALLPVLQDQCPFPETPVSSRAVLVLCSLGFSASSLDREVLRRGDSTVKRHRSSVNRGDGTPVVPGPSWQLPHAGAGPPGQAGTDRTRSNHRAQSSLSKSCSQRFLWESSEGAAKAGSVGEQPALARGTATTAPTPPLLTHRSHGAPRPPWLQNHILLPLHARGQRSPHPRACPGPPGPQRLCCGPLP